MSSNRSVTPDHDDVETHYAGLERLECLWCFRGYITITVEEDGQERDEPVACRRCKQSKADEGGSEMQEAKHYEGRPFYEGEIAGAKRIAEARVAKTVEEQIAATDGSRLISCECGCGDVGTHNAHAREFNMATTGKQYR
jgi:hypothetical protein